jgi:hypothetical protein
MTNRNLLKEAIADAKTIKETAIANAKAALEESFTPHLKSMLAAKLNEMDSAYEEDEALEPNDGTDLMEMEDEEASVEEAKMSNLKATEKETAYKSKTPIQPDLDEEINLDELLAELEMEEEGTEDENLYEAKEAEEAEEEEIDLENMTEEDLKEFIEGVIEDMVSAGEIEAGHEGDYENSAKDKAEDAKGEEEMDLDEILFELKNGSEMDELSAQAAGVGAAGGAAELAKMATSAYAKAKAKGSEFADTLGKIASALSKGMNAGLNEKKEEKMKMEDLQSELAETYEAVNILRSELNEINLLNAKLLYTNKIFKAKNLTEVQKVKVLSAFDKATSKKEAQLVYETLIEGLKEKKAIVKENLGRASKPAGTVVTTKQPILESNDMIVRFQKLAGITNY